MKRQLIVSIKAVAALFFISFSTVFGQSVPEPTIRYLNEFTFGDTARLKLTGPARVINVEGRRGLNTTSIHSVLTLKAHNMNQKRGTVSMWVMSLEELGTSGLKPTMAKSNPYWQMYPLLSDSPDPQDVVRANFKLVWMNAWHPNLIALFGKDKLYENAFDLPHKALVEVSHFAFKKHKWYNFSLTWDYDKDEYRLYVNGISIGKEDQFKRQKFHRDSINTSLYLGNPTLCYSDIKFYSTSLNEKEVYGLFRKEVTRFDGPLEEELRHTYAGKNSKPFQWKLDASWKPKLSLSLTKPADLDSLHVQGKPVQVAITKEGLLIETVDREMNAAVLDSQMYVWTKKPFEGNLYVEYEYKTLRSGGLSLLLTQASGMNREDFMTDYPLRTSGRMTMIYGEDVRSYHWEYYREMADMRNDLDNSALIKQPWNYPLAFATRNAPVAKNTWHKLQFLQIGNKLVGAIDGIILFDCTDDSFTNNGPVLDFGRIAIRCMLRSKMVFRNLNVYTKERIQTERLLEGERIRKTKDGVRFNLN
ncbi:DUF1961 family protein [Spirosoma fluviale]|uniref:Uncharacterized protein n=1 Tax=Spirosoma fluviale TaxID=1597977 RepID=A0A286GAY4_9BACT|nr:DUF1961 family protein [Spirosoma fluviale]SOD92677.1 protein of unknown function [Spirosoma fluviale]